MATDKNFIVKNGLEVGGQEVISSSGVVTAAALGGQTLGTTDSPTFANTTLTGSLRGPATFTIDPAAVGDNTGTLVIAGNLQVDGTTTTINSTTMEVDDLNITLASGAANAAAANGAGITVDGASATITYDSTNDQWDFNKDINVTGTILSTQADDNNIEVRSVGDYFPSLTIARTNGTTKTDYEWNLQIGSPGYLNFRDITNGYYPLIFRDNGDVYLGNNTSASSPVLVLDQSAASATFAGTISSGAITSTGEIRADTQLKSDMIVGIQQPGSFIDFDDDTTEGTNGITISSLSTLSLKFDSNNNDIYGFNIYGNGQSTPYLRIDNSGNVGIGTTSPSNYSGAANDLVIAGSGQKGMTIATTDGSQTSIFFADSDSGAGEYAGAINYFHSDDHLEFYTASAERMRIDSSGNVGIGITDPSERLELTRTAGKIGWGMNGNYGVRIGYFDDAGGVHGFHVDTKHLGTTTSESRFVIRADSGKVGIGTKNPAYNLDIWGATDPAVRVYNTGTGSSDDSLLRLQIAGTTARNFIYFGDTNDSDIGKIEYNHSDNSMRFTTNTAEALRITSTGEVVVGGDASIGSARFTVDQNSGASIIGADAASANGGYIQLLNNGTAKGLLGFGSNSGASSINNVALRSQSGDLEFQPNGATQMSLSHNNSTTLKLSGYASMLRLASGAGAVFGHNVEGGSNANEIKQSNSGYYGSFIKMYYNQGMAFHTMSSSGTAGDVVDSPSVGGTQRMQLDSSGNLYIGSGSQGAAINQARVSAIHNTIPAARFAQGSTSNGLACMRVRHENTTAGNYIEFRTDENVLTGIIQDVSGTMQYQSASDSRLKENVESMSEGLTEVLAMNPVKFTWKDIVTENKTVDMEGAESRGFLAQELNEQYPWAVSEGGEDEKEKPWSVDYGKLTPVLVKAIQELKAELDAAKVRITELEG